MSEDLRSTIRLTLHKNGNLRRPFASSGVGVFAEADPEAEVEAEAGELDRPGSANSIQ